jgi:hypothetical protein
MCASMNTSAKFDKPMQKVLIMYDVLRYCKPIDG